uniref:Nematode cuticle collagen N-terminal domain-containing protein n=1 Tax=Parascaris equorum TaxID=6256 RepID=A0A914RHV4_PAREQ
MLSSNGVPVEKYFFSDSQRHRSRHNPPKSEVCVALIDDSASYTSLRFITLLLQNIEQHSVRLATTLYLSECRANMRWSQSLAQQLKFSIYGHRTNLTANDLLVSYTKDGRMLMSIDGMMTFCDIAAKSCENDRLVLVRRVCRMEEKGVRELECKNVRRFAFVGVAVSTIATLTCIISAPTVYNYMQHMQSLMQNEVDFCKSRSGNPTANNYSSSLRIQPFRAQYVQQHEFTAPLWFQMIE